MSTAAEVLDRLARTTPTPLWDRMTGAIAAVGGDASSSAVSGAGSDGVARRLADAALECLRTVLASAGDRGAALDLLAADALLTHALEIAASAGPETLVEAAREALGRLVALVPAGES